MANQQDRPQPGAGDICPDLGGPAITGPIEITWPDGLEALHNIRQAANRCATYLQDIRHVLGQIASTSGQMADAMQRIHDGMGAMQGDIAYAADTLSYIADCACRGLSAQIEAAERPLLTWAALDNTRRHTTVYRGVRGDIGADIYPAPRDYLRRRAAGSNVHDMRVHTDTT